MRELYIKPHFKKLDQGLIFNGATALNYENRNVFGLIISPRCDIEHKKNDEIYYLPLVSISDWLGVDGKIIFCEKCKENYLMKLKHDLEKQGVSSAILKNNLYNLDNLIEVLQKIDINKQKISDWVSQVEVLKKITQLENNSLSKEEAKQLYELEKKQIKSILKELVENRKKEFYLLDPFDSFLQETNRYHVVLNREIKKIQYCYAEKIPTGFYKDEIPDTKIKFNDLNYKYDDIITSLSILKSPYIEHLIQHFLTNFGRIGVTDHPNNLYDHITNKINYNEVFIY